MLRATIKPSTFTVLATVLFLIALVQVLPQVDLPDTAFHENEAPVVAKNRLMQPVAPVVPSAIATAPVFGTLAPVGMHSVAERPGHPASRSLSVLFVSFLC
jgi:hypothetical protein